VLAAVVVFRKFWEFCRQGHPAMRLDFARFIFDTDTRQLLCSGREVHVSPKAFDLLGFLVEERPRALSKAFLQEHLWRDTFVCEANLPSLVSELRHAIGDNRREGRFIRTVHGYGYAFCAEAVEGPKSTKHRPPVATYWLSWERVPIALESGETIIGREPGVGVWLDVPSISRRHARIVIRDGHAFVQDEHSKNGTWVRGELAKEPLPIRNGDEIRMGSVIVTFRAWSPDAITETQAQPASASSAVSASAPARRASSRRR
jgi:DNA-binding winged helix-turn-helix (wHTH) protein